MLIQELVIRLHGCQGNREIAFCREQHTASSQHASRITNTIFKCKKLCQWNMWWLTNKTYCSHTWPVTDILDLKTTPRVNQITTMFKKMIVGVYRKQNVTLCTTTAAQMSHICHNCQMKCRCNTSYIWSSGKYILLCMGPTYLCTAEHIVEIRPKSSIHKCSSVSSPKLQEI